MTDKLTNRQLPHDYGDFLQTIKQRIRESRLRAYRSVNHELIDLYWNIGQDIVTRQERDGWGKAVVERLSVDLRTEFPAATGYSAPNLWFMRQMYSEYRDHPNLLQLVREIPWGQNIAIMTKVKEPGAREYYLRMTGELGWSRNVLLHQIKTDAYRRHGLTLMPNCK